MDVVRSNLARIGGTVSVSSELGKGTTIRLNLPLTLSVFRAMLMRADGEVFALPLESVREIANVTAEACHTVRGRQVTRLGGELVGLVPLSGGLGLRSAGWPQLEAHDRLVIVVDGGGERVGLVVDSVGQPQEIMVKPVEAYLSASGAIAGTSVMGDGRVALVLEPAATVALALAHAQQRSRCGRGGVSAVRVLVVDDSASMRQLITTSSNPTQDRGRWLCPQWRRSDRANQGLVNLTS